MEESAGKIRREIVDPADTAYRVSNLIAPYILMPPTSIMNLTTSRPMDGQRSALINIDVSRESQAWQRVSPSA